MPQVGRTAAIIATAWLLPALAGAQPATVAGCDARARHVTDPQEAVGCYKAAARSGPSAKDHVVRHLQQRLERNPSETHSRFALAYVRSTQGHDDTVDLLVRVADEYAAAGDAVGEVLARTALADFVSRRGRTADAVAQIAAGRKTADASGVPRLVAWVHTTDAWVAYRQLDYGRALRLLEEVKETADTTPDHDLRSSWMSARGANLWAIGRASEALAQYHEQAAFLARIGNKYEEATARVNIVLLTSGSAQRVLALEVARLARESGNLAAESAAYFYLSAGSPPDEARRHARRSLDLALAARLPDAISRAKSALAMFTLPVDQAEAFRLIDEAIAEARGVGDPNQAVRLRFTKATMRWRSGPREQAIADSDALLESIEALRALQPEEELRAQRFGQWRFAYYRFAGHLLAGHHEPSGTPAGKDYDLAFRTVERMRSRMLIDRLDAAGAPYRRSDAALRAVLGNIATVNRRLASLPADGGERTAALKELQALEREAADRGARLARANPAFGDLHAPQIATLAEVRQALEPGEALIAFQVAQLSTPQGEPFGAWVWTVTREGAKAVPLPAPNTLASAVDVFLGLIQRRDGSEAAAAAHLYQEYVAPAVASLPPDVTRLVIVADEALHRMPFDALRESPGAPPLGTTFRISLAPSASMWLRWRRQAAQPAPIPALVFADPTLPGYAGAAADERAVGSGLMPLPGARLEGEAVARAVGRRTRIFSGDEATEPLLKGARLSDYRMLHFAAHAVVDDLHPERTAVLLAPGARGNDDGFLQVREIVDLPLAGQVVLLSGCRTVGGTVVFGEGPLGLAHAFFRAGARAVVATLWTVRDDDAARAFALIAEALGRGEEVAGAVAFARRELASRGEPVAAWAGLVVLGDGALVPFPGGRGVEPSAWTMASAAWAMFAAGAWAVRRRRGSIANARTAAGETPERPQAL